MNKELINKLLSMIIKQKPRQIKPFGTGAHITLPKERIGQECLIIFL